MHNKENTKKAQEIIARITGELEQQGKTQAELITYLDLPKGYIVLGKQAEAVISVNILVRFQDF